MRCFSALDKGTVELEVIGVMRFGVWVGHFPVHHSSCCRLGESAKINMSRFSNPHNKDSVLGLVAVRPRSVFRHYANLG